MINAWKVLFFEDGKKKFKRFEDDKPTEAVEYAKQLKLHGILPEVISSRKAYPPPPKAKQPPRIGLLWCPYCVKWREFHDIAVHMVDGWVTPSALRCTVCTISVRDAYVRRFNPLFIAKYDVHLEMKKKENLTKKKRRH